ncbi:two-component system phosphate regulon sensor histidine kinase PhoR [Sphaerotilus hippei]|uniref:Phosphate regulon sensor protein PhoR n=1 Tax=Sphaerotilus hippei TaxID=744406 RepID=A0A318H4R9_9BURK|nr:phosphate regulon sensor histidine kinase PhoR [Sphaerotilus hippei]PXW98686.1 two-component system phosphate regulon sensor histidine kinase PhoR [Sphaerotilus hippei]
MAIFLMSLGALTGFLVGRVVGHVFWGVWIGAVLGVSLAQVRETYRALRLIRWLREGGDGPAPRAGEVWGELAYRFERHLQLRQRELVGERQRLAQFLSAIEASPIGLLLLDAEEHISWLNPVAADHLGLHRERDLGQRITNLVRHPAFVGHLQQADPVEPVSMLNHQNGLTLSVQIRPYGDGLRLILTQDVTERLRADAMRRDFVANVSHEIRTPLTVLAGFVETLTNLPLTPVERQRVLALMTQQTNRMQSLVSDLLTLAQLEGSPRPPADHWVPVSALLQQVELEAQALSKGRHQLVFHEPGQPAAAIAGHQSELLSALANLVSNAVRYTPDGGRIEVRWLAGSTTQPGCFEVRDTGIGIAREHLPRITERFYRVDGSRSRETGGTGLGLSIVKHVLQRHGAELEVDSEPGKGSCFRIVVPAVRTRYVQAVPSIGPAGRESEPATALRGR